MRSQNPVISDAESPPLHGSLCSMHEIMCFRGIVLHWSEPCSVGLRNVEGERALVLTGHIYTRQFTSY